MKSISMNSSLPDLYSIRAFVVVHIHSVNGQTYENRQLAHYRKEKGITQEHLTDIADLHPDYIGKIERGKSSPSVKTLLEILDKLEIRYGVFFDEVEK